MAADIGLMAGTGHPEPGRAAREPETLPLTGVVAALASVGAANDIVEAFDFAAGLLRRVTDGPVLACMAERSRLRVVRHDGIGRDELGRIVGHDDFRRLVTDWRDRPVPPEHAVHLVMHGEGRMVCAPVVTDRWLGLLGIAPADARMTELVEGLASHVANVARRAALGAGLAQREAELDAVIQTLPIPVLTVDGEGRLTRINPPACELFGLSGSFDVGRPIEGLLSAPEVEALLLGRDDAFEREVALGRPARPFRAVGSRVTDGDGCFARMVALEDVGVIRESKQATSDFVAVMGHELRTPLTVISGFAQTLIAREHELDQGQREQFLAAIANQSGRLTQIVEDLLFLSRERRGEPPAVTPLPVEVDRILEGIVAEFTLRVPDRAVGFEAIGHDWTLRTDRGHLEQVIRHLLDNALKFSDGPVDVELVGTFDEVSLVVIDEGPGIFSGDLDRMFEPFVQLDGSSTRTHGGAGLGLYVARQLVDALGGTLTCDSRLGVGSRFSVTLPRAAGSPVRTQQAISSPRLSDQPA